MAITADGLMQGVPGPLNGFVVVECKPLQDGWRPLAEEFWLACELVGRAVGTPHQVNVILDTTPFALSINNGDLTFNPHPGVINVQLKSFVFLDGNKMRPYSRPFRVAAILEELVH